MVTCHHPVADPRQILHRRDDDSLTWFDPTHSSSCSPQHGIQPYLLGRSSRYGYQYLRCSAFLSRTACRHRLSTQHHVLHTSPARLMDTVLDVDVVALLALAVPTWASPVGMHRHLHWAIRRGIRYRHSEPQELRWSRIPGIYNPRDKPRPRRANGPCNLPQCNEIPVLSLQNQTDTCFCATTPRGSFRRLPRNENCVPYYVTQLRWQSAGLDCRY